MQEYIIKVDPIEPLPDVEQPTMKLSTTSTNNLNFTNTTHNITNAVSYNIDPQWSIYPYWSDNYWWSAPSVYTYYWPSTYIYLYDVKCPKRSCRTRNWLRLNVTTACKGCGATLKAVADDGADYEIPVDTKP